MCEGRTGYSDVEIGDLKSFLIKPLHEVMEGFIVPLTKLHKGSRCLSDAFTTGKESRELIGQV